MLKRSFVLHKAASIRHDFSMYKPITPQNTEVDTGVTRLCKIVFDSNVFQGHSRDTDVGVLGVDLDDLKRFLEDPRVGQITLTIPEITILEIKQQRMERLSDYIMGIRSNYAALTPLKCKPPKLPTKREIERYLKRGFDSCLKKYSLEILPTPKYNRKDMAYRAATGVAPFRQRVKDGHNTDKGYKDTLLWLSLLQDAKQNKKTDYILVTSDGDFSAVYVEFKEKVSEAKFTVVKNIEELMEYLGKIYGANPEIVKLIEPVRQEVKERTGDIMVEFNKRMRSKDVYGMSHGYLSTFYANKEDEQPDGYNFSGLDISNVVPSGKNGRLWTITATLTVEPRRHESTQSSSQNIFTRRMVTRDSLLPWDFSTPKTAFTIHITYDHILKHILRMDTDGWSAQRRT